MPDFDPAYQPSVCADCGHLFNRSEPRWGPYRNPLCTPCAKAHNASASILRMLSFDPPAQREQRPFCYVGPPEPKPALRADGRVDLGIVAENRGVTE